MSETSMNPNVPVGGEGQAASKANSQITFDDVADTGNVQKPAKPKLVKDKDDEGKKEPKDTKVRGNNKEESDPFGEADDKPAPKAAKAEKEKDAAPKADPAKPKPKVHKFKIGDQIIDVAGDAIATVKINGKDEEISLQDALNDYSGSTHLRRTHENLTKERNEFVKQRDSLNALVKDLHDKSLKDPESAWDFLADLTKQDPVKLKGQILRKQYEELLPLFQMDEGERENFFKDRERDWRDRAHENRTRADGEREVTAKQEAQKAEIATKYGIDEDAYTNATKMVHQYLTKVDPQFDGKVTPEQVIYADRHLMALEVIAKTVPELEKHEKFDSIVRDTVNDLIRFPGMTREKLANLLQDVWGDEDKKGLKNLARKAAKNAQISDDDRPARRTERSDPVTFDDLD